MSLNKPKHRLVRWRVRRCPDGWLAIVLLGEERLTLGCRSSKAIARELARSHAALVRGASATMEGV